MTFHVVAYKDGKETGRTTRGYTKSNASHIANRLSIAPCNAVIVFKVEEV